MTRVALFANPLPVPVWSHQLYGEALSSAMPILTLPGRYPCPPDVRPVKIVSHLRKAGHSLSAASLIISVQNFANHSNPIGQPLVWIPDDADQHSETMSIKITI
jgi:hypothetical protein